MTPQEIHSAQQVGLAVLETAQQAGDDGAPSGVLFAALQAHGCTLSQFQSLMESLERKRFVLLRGLVYTMTPAGEDFTRTLKRVLSLRAASAAPTGAELAKPLSFA